MKQIKNFILNQSGSVAIESLGIFSIFILIATLAADIGQSLITKIKLNNLSYSLASIIRERSQLYSFSQEPLTQEDVDHLYDVATTLTQNSAISKLALSIDALSFSSTLESNQGETHSSSFTKGDIKCQPLQDIGEISNVSFYTKVKTWNSIYQVTICAELKNNFIKLGEKVFDPIGNAIVYGK